MLSYLSASAASDHERLSASISIILGHSVIVVGLIGLHGRLSLPILSKEVRSCRRYEGTYECKGNFVRWHSAQAAARSASRVASRMQGSSSRDAAVPGALPRGPRLFANDNTDDAQELSMNSRLTFGTSHQPQTTIARYCATRPVGAPDLSVLQHHGPL